MTPNPEENEDSLDNNDEACLPSSSFNTDAKQQKDELSVSFRGKVPAKGPVMDLGSGSIEDQLQKLAKEEEKSWNHLDSVHSTTTGGPRFGGQYMNDNNNGGDSVALDDSCASFATFGSGEDSENLTEAAAEAFTNLEPEMTERRKILSFRSPSSRFIRAPSKRGSNLQLIGEDDHL